MSHLGEHDKNQLSALIEEFSDIFKMPSTELGCTSEVKHRIITEEVHPIAKRPYKVPFSQREILQKEIDNMLSEGIIRPSKSPWSAPAIIVAKKRLPGQDPEIRVCIDYRELNAITKSDFFPLPNIHDTIDHLQGATYFSTMDLASGYYQVELDERDKEKSAFSVYNNHYEFNRMPMGLKNSPSTWQRLMYLILAGLTAEFCLVYLDDIIVYTKGDVKVHLEKLREIFIRMRLHNLKFKPSKCNFLKKEAKFLGHIITTEGCKTDPEKISAVKNYPQPKTIKEIRGFLGLCGFYRKFIPKFSGKAKPLSDLTKNNVPFIWEKDQQVAFDYLKNALITSPILKYPDFSKQFVLTTDASGYAISGILSQDYNGFQHPVCYGSRILNKAEKNYSTIERECLAVVHFVKKYRCYLAGNQFKIITDHAPLRYLLSIKDPSSRLARWAMSLLEFDFIIEHRPGKLNNADSLSRILNTERETDTKAIRMNTVQDDELLQIMPDMNVIWDGEQISREQHKDRRLRIIIDSVKNQDNESYYLTKNKILYKKRDKFEREDKLVVPDMFKAKIMDLFHDNPLAAHVGFRKMLDAIRKKFFWKGMTAEIKNYCESCESCAIHKQGIQTKATLQKFSVPEQPFDRISMDIVGPLNLTENGNKYILTIIDYLTKYPECIPLPDISAKTVAKAFVNRVITRHGVPNALLTDCGSQFTSKLFKEICDILKIQKLQTTPFHPECNGLIERMHRTMKTMLSHFVDEKDNSWDEYLPFVECALRNSISTVTGESPFFMMHGRDMNLPFDAILKPQRLHYDLENDYPSEIMLRMHEVHKRARELLEKQSERQSLESMKKARNKSYNVGDKVYYLRPPAPSKNLAPKLLTKWLGPFRIIRILGPVNYEIKEIYGDKIHKVHVNKLKPCKNLILNDSSSEETDEELINDNITNNTSANNNYNNNNNDNNDSETETEQDIIEYNNSSENEEDTTFLEFVVPTTIVPEPQIAPEPEVIPETSHMSTRSRGQVRDYPWIYEGRV